MEHYMTLMGALQLNLVGAPVWTSTNNQGAVDVALFMSTSVPGHFELDSGTEVISDLEALKLSSFHFNSSGGMEHFLVQSYFGGLISSGFTFDFVISQLKNLLLKPLIIFHLLFLLMLRNIII